METRKPKPAMKKTMLISLVIVVALVVVGIGEYVAFKLGGNGREDATIVKT